MGAVNVDYCGDRDKNVDVVTHLNEKKETPEGF